MYKNKYENEFLNEKTKSIEIIFFFFRVCIAKNPLGLQTIDLDKSWKDVLKMKKGIDFFLIKIAIKYTFFMFSIHDFYN